MKAAHLRAFAKARELFGSIFVSDYDLFDDT